MSLFGGELVMKMTLDAKIITYFYRENSITVRLQGFLVSDNKTFIP